VSAPAPEALIADLRAAAGDDAVSTTQPDLFAYGRDLWPKLTLQVRDLVEGTPPMAVVRPADEEAVLRTIRVIARHGTPIVPYGAGSGVCGGAAPLFGGVVVDLKRLDARSEVDETELQVTCGPGLMLQELEDRLNDAGYTLGHFPSSIWCCSVGGCVAARGAGQLSSRYGKIEDMVTGLRVATPALGVVSTGSLDPSCSPVDWTPLFVGSEGTLGLITSCRLRVHPLPAAMALCGVRFPSVGAGLAGFREVLQAGLRPSVMRLYDPLDTWMAMQKANDPSDGSLPASGGGHPMNGRARVPRSEPSGRRGLRRRARDRVKAKLGIPSLGHLLKPENLPAEHVMGHPRVLNRAIGLLPKKCLAIFGCEGDPDTAREHLAATVAAAARVGGEDLGPGPGERWYRTRYHVSFKLPKVMASGGFADTMETAIPWTRVEALYDAVRAAVSPHVLIMAHMSHAYHEGCSIYFTMGGYGANPAETAQVYGRAWDAALTAATSVGATITHHHGVGLLKRDFMDREQGAARRFWEAARVAVDGADTLNRGKLFPPTPAERPPAAPDPAPAALIVHDHADGVIEAGVGWKGVDLASELERRGHFLPPLGRDFLEGTVGDWLASGAIAAQAAVHTTWEFPLLAVEGRFDDRRAWRTGLLPRSAAGPSWLPFATGTELPGEAALATFRTLTPPPLRPVGFTFAHRDQALTALRSALRGSPAPLAGTVFAGDDVRAWRTVLQDARRPRDGGVVYLAWVDPDGFPSGSQEVVERLLAAGGRTIDDSTAWDWWEDHWATPAREGADALARTGPLPADDELGRCAAIASWRKAPLMLRAVETLVGGSARAVGWIDAPRETGCTVRWRLTSRRKGEEAALVRHEVEETLRSYGAFVVSSDWARVGELPEYTVAGRTAVSDGVRLGEAIARAWEVGR
jgi:alkyldihydroxyacetonephosphate synthase